MIYLWPLIAIKITQWIKPDILPVLFLNSVTFGHVYSCFGIVVLLSELNERRGWFSDDTHLVDQECTFK